MALNKDTKANYLQIYNHVTFLGVMFLLQQFLPQISYCRKFPWPKINANDYKKFSIGFGLWAGHIF